LTAAIFGLLGVVVGGLIATGANLWFERRREKKLARVGLYLLDADFVKASSVHYAALAHGVWVAGSDVEAEAWPDYRAALAAELDRDDWHFLALGVYAAARGPRLFAQQLAEGEGPVIPLTDDDRVSLNLQLDSIQRAQIVIGKHLGKWPAATRERPPEIPEAVFPPRPGSGSGRPPPG
jgi:hypothetical protein